MIFYIFKNNVHKSTWTSTAVSSRKSPLEVQRSDLPTVSLKETVTLGKSLGSYLVSPLLQRQQQRQKQQVRVIVRVGKGADIHGDVQFLLDNQNQIRYYTARANS